MNNNVENYRKEDTVVLFSDIHQFYLVMKEVDHGRTLSLLNAIYQLLGEVIVRHHGDLIKYIGDSFLAVFPIDTKECSGFEHAVSAGLEMRPLYETLIRENGIRHPTVLEVGIATGMIERGIVGHPSLRMDDAFGEAVTQAAMIGHHRGVAVTGAVRTNLGDTFVCNRLPDRQLKYRQEPLEVWEVISEPT